MSVGHHRFSRKERTPTPEISGFGTSSTSNVEQSIFWHGIFFWLESFARDNGRFDQDAKISPFMRTVGEAGRAKTWLSYE
jgi:hypothetical protein